MTSFGEWTLDLVQLLFILVCAICQEDKLSAVVDLSLMCEFQKDLSDIVLLENIQNDYVTLLQYTINVTFK